MKILKSVRFEKHAEKSPIELREQIERDHPCIMLPHLIPHAAVIEEILERLCEKGFVKCTSRGEMDRYYSYHLP